MPGIPAARRRSQNGRSRSSRQRQPSANASEPLTLEDRRPKKRRYIPGGPGGGGRYVDPDGTEVPVGGTGPGGYNYVGPRGRIGRENMANGLQPVPYERPRRESRRERAPARPRYSSAAAAAAAVVQGDGFKPREERGWEEFHQDLDFEAKFPVFSADEVDGIIQITPTNLSLPLLTNGISLDGEMRPGSPHSGEQKDAIVDGGAFQTPTKMDASTEIGEGHLSETPGESTRRRPGRPPRRHESMLKGIGTPDTPKVIPIPGPNPREKLTLPKPSFRRVDPFISYEQAAGQFNYVDRTMANVGYQESDIYIRPEKKLIRVTDGTIEEELNIPPAAYNDGDSNIGTGGVSVGRVEYDMDEQDQKWLDEYNAQRKTEQVEPIKPAIFEITMTKIEKEWHALEKRIPKPNPKPPQTHRPRSSSAAAVNGETAGAGEEQDSKCAICDDGDCENTNAIVFCDGCDLAVHQECYGVPYIPEGQWLCRKCQLIGRGTPTCIFCPNTEGAFKQTNSSKWSHLLCAIWIPEVSLGNPTFMEPVMEVEKVPKQRWKLTCYICRQKMGACIQCGNKNCFVAFHVSCARRAKLFLQMKTTHGGPASFDSNHLKAYCDKHVPTEWRKDNDVDTATADAIDYYRYTMRGKLWADSQQSAMSMTAVHDHPPSGPAEEEPHPKINLIVGGNKRKRNQPPKTVWRLPSGAPVIPATLYDSLENSLQRFTVRKRRDFAADMCRYWTLKREAKRGAALLKRLQLQMETFSSMEITRRNFVGMGAAGRVRLQRRIDFAERLLEDVEKLRTLCEKTREREGEKLKDAEMQKDIVDTVYSPIPPLLWPIIEKAQALDGKGTFHTGLLKIRERLEERFYTSVATFSADLGTVFSSAIGIHTVIETADVQSHIVGDAFRKDLSAEQKEKRKLAKRIIKAVQASLEDATRKESELCRKPFEKELKDLDLLLEASISSRRDSVSGSLAVDGSDDELLERKPLSNGETHDRMMIDTQLNVTTQAHVNEDLMDIDGRPVNSEGLREGDPISADHHGLNHAQLTSEAQPFQKDVPAKHPTPSDSHASPPMADLPVSSPKHNPNITSHPLSLPTHVPPPTPPLSSGGDHQTPLSNGGIPWYMEPFDPEGTTINEERWTGREVARGMSEELSDMDEEELSGLVDSEMGGLDEVLAMKTAEIPQGTTEQANVAGGGSKKNKSGKQKKRWRGFK